MKLIYLTTLQYPSPYANRVNVMKMAASFNDLVDDFTLVIGPLLASKEEVLRSYGIERPFVIEVLGPPPIFWPKSFFSALRLRKLIKRESSITRHEPPETVFYIRDFLLAYFLSHISSPFQKNYFIECQSLGKFFHVIYRRVFQKARGIISSNHAKIQEIHERYGVPLERMMVGPNGFDEALFNHLPSPHEARAHLGFPQDKRIVLYAGSTLGWKGTDIIRDIAKALPDILFVIVGAHAEKQEGNMVHIRKQDLRRVPMYLRAADVLIAPYRSDTERAQRYFSPIKIFEYMASGIPFVTTDLPAVREFLNEDNAFLVKEYSAKAFEETIRYAFDHREERERRAKNAKEQSRYFSWQNRAVRIVGFLEQRLRT